MKTWLALLDRTAVLFLGLAAGAAIAWAFVGERQTAPTPVPVVIAPPPPGSKPKPGQPAAATAAGPECAMPFQQALLVAVAAGRPVRVGVFGDSFGDGVWSGLNRLLRPPLFEVARFSKQATGFTRYRSLNLEDQARAQTADKPVQIAVISYGANDEQGIFADGHYAALMSPAWQAVIGKRVEGLVGELRAQGAMVYWVGLPRMRKASYDADMQAMNAFYAARMAKLGVPWIDTRPSSSGPDGGYAPYLPDPKTGKDTLMRAEDGIHMSMNGYVWITRGLAQRIRAYVDAARVLAGAPAPAEKQA